MAVATLAYNHGEATAWLDDLAAESHPSTYDLCRRHASQLAVPRGWELRDRRNLVADLSTRITAS
jgi:hypothetical protein